MACVLVKSIGGNVGQGSPPIRENVLALLIGGLAFGQRQTAREIAPGACVMLAGMVLLGLAG